MKHFEERREKNLDNNIAEEPFQCSEDYVICSENEYAYERDGHYQSEEEEM